MNRWLHKLTKKEIWQLHHDVICEDSLKKCEISKMVNDVTDETEVECTFYENWKDEGKNCYIPTSYTFKDFDYTDWETSGGDWNDQAEYRTWLAKRFGIPYLADLLEQKAGVKADLVIKILGEVESSCDTCAIYFPDDGCMAGLADGEVME